MFNFKKLNLKKQCLAFFVIFFLLASYCLAEEKITNYDVNIQIRKNSDLLITEEITVISEKRKIKRGIFRDFPTRYKDTKGLKYNVGFEVKSVKRNDKNEAYHTNNLSNGKRVYIGSQNKFLSNGLHKYTLVFKTNQQLGFFKEHDELYFNAIGHGWDFKIDKATVNVELPKLVGKSNLKIDGFTGYQGSKAKNFDHEKTQNGAIFTINKSLMPKQGFTIVISWPKGVIKEPSAIKKNADLISANSTGIMSFLLCCLALITNFYLWLLKGKDPKKGIIYPRFMPPKDIEPYDIPFLQNMGYTAKCLSSLIVSTSVKGHSIVEEEPSILGFGSSFVIKKTKLNKEDLNSVEKKVLGHLVSDYMPTLKCTSANHSKFTSARITMSSLLKNKLGKFYRKNSGYILPGLLLNVLGIFLAISYANPKLIALVFAISFNSSLIFILIIKRYNEIGRKLLDEIDGYKLYLDTAEKGHYDDINFPEITTARFENHLPYAVALGVEASWMSAFRKAMEIKGLSDSAYQPHFYSGSRSWHRSNFMTDASSSFSSRIASSSIPPGSSSGFSGGGSSGGGGGGGGGGGW